MSGRGFEDGAQSDDDPIHAMKAVGNKRARLGLSDVPEESQGSSARKVVFCVGDLTQLKETEWAWEYAKASLVHEDDYIYFVHVTPHMDFGKEMDDLLRVPSLFQGYKNQKWLPPFIERDLRTFKLNELVLLNSKDGVGEAVCEFVHNQGNISFAACGSRDLDKVSQVLLGSTSKYIVNNCPCPTVCIRKPFFGTKTLLQSMKMGVSRPRNVVIALDDNERLSQAVVDWSLSNILLLDDTVTFVSAVSLSSERAKRRAFLHRVGEKIASFQSSHSQVHGTSAQVHVLFGSPGPVICKAIKDSGHPCELLICGTRGQSGLMRYALGSVSSYFMDNLQCPVCVVRSL